MGKIGILLGKHNLPKFILIDRKSKKLVSVKEIKRLMGYSTERNTQRIIKNIQRNFTKEFHIIFKDQIMPLLLKLF